MWVETFLTFKRPTCSCHQILCCEKYLWSQAPFLSSTYVYTSSHYKVLVRWMPRPCVPKQWDLGQKLRCLWKAWSMAFHALKVVKWALMTPSGHKLTKCKKVATPKNGKNRQFLALRVPPDFWGQLWSHWLKIRPARQHCLLHERFKCGWEHCIVYMRINISGSDNILNVFHEHIRVQHSAFLT